MKLLKLSYKFDKLTYGKSRIDFRNNKGRALAHRGGGHKRLYRVVDFKRQVINVPGIVINLEYDPNRTALLALVSYSNGIICYILAPFGITPGSIIQSGVGAPLTAGSAFPLKYIPVGYQVHNVELYKNKGGVLARAAGTFCKILRKLPGYVILQLASGEERALPEDNLATVGRVSNWQHNLKSLKKAGISRRLGRRPSVRGVAKNPVDHPHGGGEGKASGGRPSVTPWGKITKGQGTRKSRQSQVFIVKFRKNKLNKRSLFKI